MACDVQNSWPVKLFEIRLRGGGSREHAVIVELEQGLDCLRFHHRVDEWPENKAAAIQVGGTLRVDRVGLRKKWRWLAIVRICDDNAIVRVGVRRITQQVAPAR